MFNNTQIIILHMNVQLRFSTFYNSHSACKNIIIIAPCIAASDSSSLLSNAVLYISTTRARR